MGEFDSIAQVVHDFELISRATVLLDSLNLLLIAV
jgi:hypothetical protein